MAILKYRDESGKFSPLSFIISVPGENNPQQVYELPIASADVLGGVKVDNDTIVIDANGVIKTTITSPTKVSELENDSRFITLGDIPAQGGTSVPTKLSELENDTNFVTEVSLNSKLGDIESILNNIIGG